MPRIGFHHALKCLFQLFNHMYLNDVNCLNDVNDHWTLKSRRLVLLGRMGA